MAPPADPAPNGRPFESVWDYPRPPRVVADERLVVIGFAGADVARSRRAVRVLETASPPTVYLPPDDVRLELLSELAGKHSLCEWKGRATYYDLVVGERRSEAAAWLYPRPNAPYLELRGWVSFFPARVDEIELGGEPVEPQPGRFYGGWVTAEVQGPIKGEPGTEAW